MPTSNYDPLDDVPLSIRQSMAAQPSPSYSVITDSMTPEGPQQSQQISCCHHDGSKGRLCLHYEEAVPLILFANGDGCPAPPPPRPNAPAFSRPSMLARNPKYRVVTLMAVRERCDCTREACAADFVCNWGRLPPLF